MRKLSLRQRKRSAFAKPWLAAEQRTAGEIVPMLVGASARYAEIEIAGMGVGLVAGTLASFVYSRPLGSHPFTTTLASRGRGTGIYPLRYFQ